MAGGQRPERRAARRPASRPAPPAGRRRSASTGERSGHRSRIVPRATASRRAASSSSGASRVAKQTRPKVEGRRLVVERRAGHERRTPVSRAAARSSVGVDAEVEPRGTCRPRRGDGDVGQVAGEGVGGAGGSAARRGRGGRRRRRRASPAGRPEPGRPAARAELVRRSAACFRPGQGPTSHAGGVDPADPQAGASDLGERAEGDGPVRPGRGRAQPVGRHGVGAEAEGPVGVVVDHDEAVPVRPARRGPGPAVVGAAPCRRGSGTWAPGSRAWAAARRRGGRRARRRPGRRRRGGHVDDRRPRRGQGLEHPEVRRPLDDHDVARFDQGLDQEPQGLLRAVGDQHPGRVDAAQLVVGDPPAQRRLALGGAVLEGAARRRPPATAAATSSSGEGLGGGSPPASDSTSAERGQGQQVTDGGGAEPGGSGGEEVGRDVVGGGHRSEHLLSTATGDRANRQGLVGGLAARPIDTLLVASPSTPCDAGPGAGRHRRRRPVHLRGAVGRVPAAGDWPPRPASTGSSTPTSPSPSPRVADAPGPDRPTTSRR